MKFRSQNTEKSDFRVKEILFVSSPYHLYSLNEDICFPQGKVTTAPSMDAAVALLGENEFDLIFVEPHSLGESLNKPGQRLKQVAPGTPVILLVPPTQGAAPEAGEMDGVDHAFIWSGTPEMFTAMVQLMEDQHCNDETRRAVLLVEDSIQYFSRFLPAVYREIASCSHSATGKKPRLLLAETHEAAISLFRELGDRMVCVLSDTRLPRNGQEDPGAGISLLSAIYKEMPDLPSLLMSAESENREKAALIPAPFLDKNSTDLDGKLHDFFQDHAGIHTQETAPASLEPLQVKAGAANFSKIGQGSMGGKARGLAFLADLLNRRPDLDATYEEMDLRIPNSLVLCTDIFEHFVDANHLKALGRGKATLLQLVQGFIDAPLPRELVRQLEAFLAKTDAPLAVRSSSLLEDAHFQPYAGLYKTYMIPNNHTDLKVRLTHLTTAVKLVFASTYYKDAQTFCRNTTAHPFEDSMAVLIQEISGRQYGDFFYPGVSGTAQSVNFYPFADMESQDGVLNLALGLGHTLAQGEQSFRVSPKFPQVTPQFAHARDYLDHTQNQFYALRTKDYPEELRFGICSNLERRSLAQALEEEPVKALTSTYVPAEDRIRDTWYCDGPKALTFARILKYETPRLTALVNDLLDHLTREMGAPVEIEFAANIPKPGKSTWEISLLQVRPMLKPMDTTVITQEDMDAAVCVSTAALGNGTLDTIEDIVYVNPDRFEGGKTQHMAREISRINARLRQANRRFLLAGPGRWGSSDPWLGIPVNWDQISGAGAIVEIRDGAIHADASQGSHFFNTITAQGIPYITVNQARETSPDRIDLGDMATAGTIRDEGFIRHLRLDNPLKIKIDGKHSRCVILDTGKENKNTQAA
ncbi:MAG: PEP/pyruvate-binding domain-containing protein [Desulfobacterales bacterium]|nr:PEP/pyruvate-binding domain-containing protein [Desulfobacterales bacterium]